MNKQNFQISECAEMLASKAGMRIEVPLARDILESCTEYAIIALNLDLTIIAWNEGAHRLFGYEAIELVDKVNFLNIHSPKDLQSGKIQKILEIVNQAGLYSGELKFLHKNGAFVSFLFTLTTRKDFTGKFIGYTIVAHDQTEFSCKLQKITESKEYNRSLIESNIDVLITTDSLGIINDVNRQFCEMMEFTQEELVGSPFKIHFTDPKCAEDMIRKVLSENRIHNYELIIQSRHAKLIPVSFNATTLRTSNGGLRGIFAAGRDITEQKRLENKNYVQNSALLEMTNILNDVLKNIISYSIIALDLEANILVWSEGAKYSYGYPLEDIIGKKKLWILHTPEDIESGRAATMLEQAFETGKYEGVLEGLRKNGERFPVRISVTTRKDSDGHPIGYVLISKDITLQIQQEKKLQEQVSNSRNLFEFSLDFLIITDVLGVITDVNKQVCIATEYKPEEFIGKKFKNFFTDPKRAENCIRNVLADENVKNHELTIKAKSEKKIIISCNISTFKGADNKLRGIFVIARDVADKKNEEVLLSKGEELLEQHNLVQEANQLKNEFLTNVSHELRNPLNGIIGFTEMMYLGKVGSISTEHKEYLGDILTNSRHLLHLINNILDLAKVESGKMKFHPESVDLRAIIKEVLDMFDNLVVNKKIQINIDIDPSISNIIIDSVRLKQVFYNYISNAIRFTNDSGSINIRIIPEGSENFCLEVEDNGIGIHENDLPKLFAEFQQLDTDINKKYQGTGLGLVLTKRIVEVQKGKVGVRSIPNKGSIFFAILPKKPHHYL